ncbi:hypothetical protein RFI_34345, partial [Reticulomyxa filosa]
GIQLKSIFQNVMYIDFGWRVAKAMAFFPPVEYLEALPTLKFGQDMPTYAHILKTSFQSSDSRSASALWKKTLSLTQFLLKLDRSIKGLKMKSTIEVKKALNPQYVVDTLIAYLNACICYGQSAKKKIIIFAQNAELCKYVNIAASDIAELCTTNGLHAGAVHYLISPDKYQDTIDAFVNGHLQVLVNVNIVNEGFDLPSVDCI